MVSGCDHQGLKGAEARHVGADRGPVRPGEERRALCPWSRSDSLNVQVSGPKKHDCFSSVFTVLPGTSGFKQVEPRQE